MQQKLKRKCTNSSSCLAVSLHRHPTPRFAIFSKSLVIVAEAGIAIVIHYVTCIKSIIYY